MRLWSWQILPFLPRAQLVSQFRECCCIARNIAVNGTPNHILVNRIMDYPDGDFNAYTETVAEEMERRGYNVDRGKFYKYRSNDMIGSGIFDGWHTKRYVRQNFANLMEKYDNGGLTATEWIELLKGYRKLYGEEYVL